MSWSLKWALILALCGVFCWFQPGLAAKINRVTDKDGTVHISNEGAPEAGKPGGPPGASAPTPVGTLPPQQILPAPPPPAAPEPPGQPPVMEQEPPPEPPAPEAGDATPPVQPQHPRSLRGGRPPGPPQ